MRISFIHSGGESWASYRYRARRPAEALGASLNDPTADVLVFVKPVREDLETATAAQRRGARVVFDICDDHFGHDIYRQMAHLADFVTCPTTTMATHLASYGIHQPIAVVPDPYEFEQLEPRGVPERPRLLWFGHALNLGSLVHVLPSLLDYPVEIVSNIPVPGYRFTPWSLQNLRDAFKRSDIVILPATVPWKSPNRTVEAIRQGLPVVAAPTPALRDFPGVYLGRIREGIETLIQEGERAAGRVREGQAWIEPRYSLETCAEAWREALAGVLV